MLTSSSARETTLELVRRLDEDVTFEDIMYELHVLQKIERGQHDAEEGRTVSHDEVEQRLDKWLK